MTVPTAVSVQGMLKLITRYDHFGMIILCDSSAIDTSTVTLMNVTSAGIYRIFDLIHLWTEMFMTVTAEQLPVIKSMYMYLSRCSFIKCAHNYDISFAICFNRVLVLFVCRMFAYFRSLSHSRLEWSYHGLSQVRKSGMLSHFEQHLLPC